MYLGLVKRGVSSPDCCCCLGTSRRDAVVIHTSPNDGFDVKNTSPMVSWYLESAAFVQQCQNRVKPFFFLPTWVTDTYVGPLEISPTFCHPSLSKFAAAYDNQAFIW